MIELTSRVYAAILATVGSSEPETGGILGADAKTAERITHFYFDQTGGSEQDSYTPDVLSVNRVLKEQWHPCGIQMVGIVHSHTHESGPLSCGDICYGEAILRALPGLHSFLLPLLQPGAEVCLQCYRLWIDAQDRPRVRKESYHVIG